jgi:hypothetical protein
MNSRIFCCRSDKAMVFLLSYREFGKSTVLYHEHLFYVKATKKPDSTTLQAASGSGHVW